MAATVYASTADVQDRMAREMPENERAICQALLEDAAVMIDAYAQKAASEAKKIVFVKDDDKKRFEANVVYKNELIDIAVLKIDVSNMPYLSISDSVKPLKIGTEIVILGYPSGTDVSENVSAFEGKVSNFIGGIKSYITDAIAAPGSSGGALIAKKDGKVYGVLRGGYKETLGVDINASSDIRDLFKQDDIIIEYN